METLYQYAVLRRPTEGEWKAGMKSTIVIPPSGWILAKNVEQVVMLATRQIPEEFMVDADRLEVAVSPF